MKTKIILLTLLIIGISSLSELVWGQITHTRKEAVLRQQVSVMEGNSIDITVNTYDPDGDTIMLTIEDLPIGATTTEGVLMPDGFYDPTLPPAPEGSSWYQFVINWIPTYEQKGIYMIYVHAEDGKGGEDWAKIEITVTDVNRAPVL